MDIEELDILIRHIYDKFDSINNNWKSNENFTPINMKKKKVVDIFNNNQISDTIFYYHKYVFDLYGEIYQDTKNLNLVNDIEVRIKSYTSVQDKINRYYLESKHSFGEVPINKCLNDILGFRIIFNDSINLLKTIDYIRNNYPNLICIDSSKNGYIATHVYFINNDNYKFRWELQLWNKEDEKSNKICHEKYKQKYTKYEEGKEEDEYV